MRRDGLDDAEQAFGVGAIDSLSAACCVDAKGGGNLPPPFGKLWVAAPQVFDIAFWLNGFGQYA